MSTWLAVTTMAAIWGSVTVWAEAAAAGIVSAAMRPATYMTFIRKLLFERIDGDPAASADGVESCAALSTRRTRSRIASSMRLETRMFPVGLLRGARGAEPLGSSLQD